MDLIQKPHRDKIKHGGEIAVSGSLDRKDLIAVERVRTSSTYLEFVLFSLMWLVDLKTWLVSLKSWVQSYRLQKIT